MLALAGESRGELGEGAWVVNQPWTPGAPLGSEGEGGTSGVTTLAVSDLAGRSVHVTPAAWAV